MRIHFDRKLMLERVILDPGDFHTAAGDRVIYTVLGSCVSACLMDEAAGIAGMNHFMLPQAVSKDALFSTDIGRYGIQAMELLVNEMLLRGASRNRIKAKIFGGGHVIPSMASSQLPESNIDAAVTFLETENIPIVARDVGGFRGRKVSFFTNSGRVKVEMVQQSDLSALGTNEQSLQKRIVRSEKSGDFVLFDRRFAK